MAERRHGWHVICVTDGNADGRGIDRHEQFARACEAFGVKHFDFFDLPDRYEMRLKQEILRERLNRWREHYGIRTVYTHGPIGEYGHPHHQDVSLAVHEVFAGTCDVFGVAYNCLPSRIVKLSARQFDKKTDVLSNIYFGETSRFIQILPATDVEMFAQFALPEVRDLHKYLSQGDPIPTTHLNKYKWFYPYLSVFRDTMIKRPF